MIQVLFQFSTFRTPILILALFLPFIPTASAQTLVKTPNVPKKALKLYEDAREHLKWDRFSEAVKTLDEAIAIMPGFADAIYMKAGIFFQAGRYRDALAAYERTREVFPEYSPLVLFGIGESLFYLEEFEPAKQAFQSYLSASGNKPARLQHVKARQKNIAFALEAIKSPVPFKPKVLPSAVNTPEDEYFPSVTADGSVLFFTRRVQVSDRFSQEDIFFSKIENNHWQKAEALPSPVNTPKNEGALSISADGRFLYFTACEMPDSYGGCDIYVSEKKAGKWSAPKNLGPKINSRYKDTQPCISADGKTLWFVSGRPGGMGELDIWFSTLGADGFWQEPQNAGPKINSPGNEQRPFIFYDNRTLFFSSDGHPGIGNLDMFKVVWENNEWSAPIHLGYPLNSPFDDDGLFLAADGKTAWFSSNKFSEGFGMDIVQFELPEIHRPAPVAYVRAKVTAATNNRPVEAAIRIFEPLTGKTLTTLSTDPGDGSFLVCLPSGMEYGLNIDKPGFLFYSENFSLEKLEAGEVLEREIALQPLETGKAIILRNVFFETGSAALSPASETEIQQLAVLLNTNPHLVVEIGGHTDATGNKETNRKLSEKRAKALYDKLLEKGIPARQLTWKGYADSRPVAPNDTEEGKALNRRTEALIIDQKSR